MPDNRNVVQAGTMFPPELVRDVFDKVMGHSTLARLCAAKPMSFSGIQEFVFTMEGEASFVAESGQKPAGKAAGARNFSWSMKSYSAFPLFSPASFITASSLAISVMLSMKSIKS